MVSRVYVEKKPGFDGEARALAAELRDIVGISGLTGVRLLNRYDVEGMTRELVRPACAATCVFRAAVRPGHLQVDARRAEDAPVFAVESLPGQYDQRADSCAQCIQLITQGERPAVRTAWCSSCMAIRPKTRGGHQELRHQPGGEPGRPLWTSPTRWTGSYDVPADVATLDGLYRAWTRTELAALHRAAAAWPWIWTT